MGDGEAAVALADVVKTMLAPETVPHPGGSWQTTSRSAHVLTVQAPNGVRFTVPVVTPKEVPEMVSKEVETIGVGVVKDEMLAQKMDRMQRRVNKSTTIFFFSLSFQGKKSR